MKPMECRPISWAVAPQGEPTYSEMATTICIEDEAGGEFVEVCQSGRAGLGKIQINPDEWLSLRDAIDNAIKSCRDSLGGARCQ